MPAYVQEADQAIATISQTMPSHVLNSSSCQWADGYQVDHYAMHSTLYASWFGLNPSQCFSTTAALWPSRGMVPSVYGALTYLKAMMA